MSDESTATPAAVDTSVQAAPAAVQPEVDQKRINEIVAERLDRERKTLAKRFGVASLDEVDGRLAKAAELEKSRLTEDEKARARLAELEHAAKERDEYRSAVQMQAESAMAGLTEAQRDAVLEAAGDSPVKQVRLIEKLRPTWAQVAAAAPKPIPAPAQTAPNTTAPAPTAPGAENVLATYEELAKTNPMAAAHYRLSHLNAYYEALNSARK